MEIRLLAFDLDGTTIVNHRELPERNRQALLAGAVRHHLQRGRGV